MKRERERKKRRWNIKQRRRNEVWKKEKDMNIRGIRRGKKKRN